ncbi:hypothetical protein C8J56DRAFT_789984, partial [Mycena floridula]
KNYRNTHIYGYFMALLLANVIQASGTLLNFAWVSQEGVVSGGFCSLQAGGTKQFGNVATSFWACMLSIHIFNLLFLRMGVTWYAFWGTVVCGWGLVLLVVLLGPLAVQRPENGPYFGPSGAWCWITDSYGIEQVFLEYFLEYVAAGVSFLLYVAVLLRVRGNLVLTGGSWRFRKVPDGEAWKLAFSRDLLDTAMMSMSKMMVWYPVVYTALLIPITITRLSEFAGNSVPFGATVIADVIYNLTGLFNVIIFVMLDRMFPELQGLPLFHSKRPPILTLKSGAIVDGMGSGDLTAQGYRRGQAVYIPFPERAHFPSFARRHSDSDDESWGNKDSASSSDFGSEHGYYTEKILPYELPRRPPEPPREPPRKPSEKF